MRQHKGPAAIVTVVLLVMIVMQFLSMMQSDRLYERLNTVIELCENQWSTSESTVSRPTTASEDAGDWFVYHLSGEPRTLNPFSVESSLDARDVYADNIIESFFDYDLDYDGVKLIPKLAESMQFSEDGLEVTVRLKENIWFSDGEPVTADDVIFTYNTIMDPGIDAEDSRSYFQNFKGVVRIDDRTVKFILKEVFWKTVETVGTFQVLAEHIYAYDDPKEFNERRSNPVGSGPYVFEKWNVGQQIVLQRNENYWGQRPKIDKLVFRIITNHTAALQALRAGAIDYFEPGSEQYVEMTANEQFMENFYALKYWEPAYGFAYIGWNADTPFFNDKRVRLAMTHLIDRESIVKHLSKGLAKVPTGPFYIYGKQNDPTIKPWPYDVERAKELLRKAGWLDVDGDGILERDNTEFRFKLSYPSGNTSGDQLARLLKNSASKVGIEVQADPIEWSIFLQRLTARELAAAFGSWGGTIESDPYQFFHSSQIDGGSNYFGFRNNEADRIIEQARRELDPEKRYALYHKFQRILHEKQPYTYLFTRPRYVFLDKRFENVKVHKLGIDYKEWYVPKEKQRYK